MKQVSQNYKSGNIRLEEVCSPALKSGGVLIRTQYSVISAGTEGMKVKEGKLSYVGKARARPDQVKKVVQSIKQQGLLSTYKKVMNKLDSLTPLGYSASGIVVEVGRGAEEFKVGQRVACAGAGYANHAEINFVPKNLVVAVPDDVSMEQAAFSTIGAVALQGLRQAEMQLGEVACVIGLGLLGQLTVQLLKASGVQVIGIDLMSSRCELAKKLGASAAVRPDASELDFLVKQLTGGIGVDCIFITAGGDSNGPVELAVDVARDRARVIDVGKTRLDLPWNAYFEKELDVRFSRSYGPGRYDPNYEEKGIDYPVGYVRWTERRNMDAFIQLLATDKLDLAPIISSVRPFDQAEQVYQSIAKGGGDVLGVVFKHADQIDDTKRITFETSSSAGGIKKTSNVQLGVIGAGSYASSMLLPHLHKHTDVDLVEVATATSLSGKNAAEKFGFKRMSTDYKGMLEASDVDAVIIATRHASHATMVSEALRHKKDVYVEKPLAIDVSGLEQVRRAVVESENHRLMVGFNRRFSPAVQKISEIISNQEGPKVINYRVHAGQLDSGAWYLDRLAQGSRFVGEAGHFIDVFSFLIGARPVSVLAKSLRSSNVTDDELDNISVVIDYEDGSVCNLQYLTQGGFKVPKEYMELYGSGRTIQLHNFEYLMLFEGNNEEKIKLPGLDKGQKQEMQALVKSMSKNESMPISLESLFDTTLVTLAAEESIKSNRVVKLSEYFVSANDKG